MSDLQKFREDTRAWLDANCPASIRANKEAAAESQFTKKRRSGDSVVWLERMAEKGWIAPTWPREYGGGGLSAEQAGILREEMRRIKAPPPYMGMGLTMIGPTLLEFGTEDQKQRHIPGITSGEVHWCQGYSEPNAGSDLANLQTRAEDQGDHFLVNGSKIWTSGAMYADWMFCLTRTDSTVQKQKGITFLLFPMDDPGITVKPIRLISGESPFCQVFFDNVKAKKDDLVGKVNEGWTVGKRLLQHERNSIGGGGTRMGLSVGVVDVARQYRADDEGHIEDPLLRQQLIEHQINSQAFALTNKRIMDEAMNGQTPGFTTSMLKYYGSELTKASSEMMVSMMGPQGLGRDDTEHYSNQELEITRAWLFHKALTIAGGCSEVQLDIISKRILELPPY